MVKPQDGVIPGQDEDESPDVDLTSGTRYAGGVTSYTPPPNNRFGNPNNPYLWVTDDWQMLLTMDSKDVSIIQNQLAKAFPGFRPGKIGDRTDARTQKQFREALGRINMLQQDKNSPLRGKKINDALTELAKYPTSPSGSSSSGARVSVRLTNPEDLKTVFQKASQQTLGRSLSDKELARLAESYNSLEKSYGYDIASGGAVTAPPDMSTYGIEQAKKASPGEAEAVQYASYIDTLSKMMGG